MRPLLALVALSLIVPAALDAESPPLIDPSGSPISTITAQRIFEDYGFEFVGSIGRMEDTGDLVALSGHGYYLTRVEVLSSAYGWESDYDRSREVYDLFGLALSQTAPWAIDMMNYAMHDRPIGDWSITTISHGDVEVKLAESPSLRVYALAISRKRQQ